MVRAYQFTILRVVRDSTFYVKLYHLSFSITIQMLHGTKTTTNSSCLLITLMQYLISNSCLINICEIKKN